MGSVGIILSIVWRVWKHLASQLVHPDTGLAQVAVHQTLLLPLSLLSARRGRSYNRSRSLLNPWWVRVDCEVALMEPHQILAPLLPPPPPSLLLLVELPPDLLTNLLPRRLLLLPLSIVCLLAHALHLDLLLVVGCNARRSLVCVGPLLGVRAKVVEHLLAHHLHLLALGAGKGRWRGGNVEVFEELEVAKLCSQFLLLLKALLEVGQLCLELLNLGWLCL